MSVALVPRRCFRVISVSLVALTAAVVFGGCVPTPPASPIAGGISVPESLVSDDPMFSVAHAMVRFRTKSCLNVSTGSGFAIDEHRIVTNRHVVGGASVIEAETWDGRPLHVTSSKITPDNDLAVVEVSDTLSHTLKLGDEEPPAGSTINVVGYPLGNALRFDEGTAIEVTDGADYGSDRVVLIDAKIRHGNSGGPIVNSAGLVVGVVFRFITLGDDTGLAIPVTSLRKELDGTNMVANPDCDTYTDEYGWE